MWEALWVTDLAGREGRAQHGVGTGPGGVSALPREGALPALSSHGTVCHSSQNRRGWQGARPALQGRARHPRSAGPAIPGCVSPARPGLPGSCQSLCPHLAVLLSHLQRHKAPNTCSPASFLTVLAPNTCSPACLLTVIYRNTELSCFLFLINDSSRQLELSMV